jgi:hypothetical protein
MSFRDQFPDYPVESFPAIPAGFEDASWHNCACPCLVSDEHQMTIWLDYPEPSTRENGPGYPRFIVEHQKDGIETGLWAESGDSWSEVLAIIETHKPR